MNFGKAIEALKNGNKVQRKGWNGKGMYLWLCAIISNWTDSDGNTYKRLPYIYMKTADDHVVPWVASQTDVLAEDWEII